MKPVEAAAPVGGVACSFMVLLLAVLGAAPAPAEAAECRPEGQRGAATAESCAIAGTDYRLVRVRTSVPGTVGAAVELLRDSASCPQWQAMCAEERSFRDGAGHRSIRHRRSGSGFTRRVLVSRNYMWRSGNGGVVLELVGADQAAAQFEGTRILCLRERWSFVPTGGGRLQVLVELVSDPQPPFGLIGAVTASSAQTLLETLDNLAVRLRSVPARSDAALAALPPLTVPLPDLGASFVHCQNARRR